MRLKKYLQLMIGTEKIPKKCIICTGTMKEQWIKNELKIFDSYKKLACRGIGCSYLVRSKKEQILLIFNVWGANASLTVTDTLIKGGAENLIFIGWAGGLKTKDIGAFVLPSKVYPLDGLTKLIKPKMRFAYPDRKIFSSIKCCFDRHNIDYSVGATMSIPSANPRIYRQFANRIKRLKPTCVELELATFYFVAKERKIPAAAILIISDTSKKCALSKTAEKLRVKSHLHAIKCACEILTHLS